jgi:hypothetical protein
LPRGITGCLGRRDAGAIKTRSWFVALTRIMSVMSSPAAGLLAEIDALPYPDRMRLLAGRARALAGSPEIAEVLGELARGNRFQRQIALFMAVVSGHQPTIEAARGDPDWDIRRGAVSVWLRSGRRCPR